MIKAPNLTLPSPLTGEGPGERVETRYPLFLIL